MELKPLRSGCDTSRGVGSNRTFMELKQQPTAYNKAPAFSSNRTFMELKLFSAFLVSTTISVLIVPLWNWNSNFTSTRKATTCSNRTFMELKRLRYKVPYLLGIVLIVPLWNWNQVIYAKDNFVYTVLIVPLWNWNSRGSSQQEAGRGVLIVPLWNWNASKPAGKKKNECSNRTFMELKLVCCLSEWTRWDCSNRTFMELKLGRSWSNLRLLSF